MTQAPVATKRLLSASAVMASGTLASRLLGFVRVMLVAFVLGNGTRQADMFSLALMVPTSLYILFAGGALNTVLVPQIVRAIKNDPDDGESYTNRVMTAFLLIVGVVALIVTIGAPVVVWIYSSSRWRVPELADHYHSMVLLTYLTLPQVFFFGAFFLIGQVLNARDRFGPMMWAPIANNVVQVLLMIGYAIVWGGAHDKSVPFTTAQVLTLGIGSTLGIVAQTLVLIPFMRATGYRYRPRFDFRNTGLGHTFHLAKWTLGFVAVNQLALVVVNKLATSATAAGHGAGLTVYNNAYLLWILPHSLVTVSLATAMLPSASRMAAEGNLAGVRDELLRTVKLATTLLLPTAVGFVVLAFPITRIAFGHGQGAKDPDFVAWALIAFAIGLVPFTIQYICLRAFYALEDTRTTFVLQVIIASLNAGLGVLLVVPFHRPGFVAAGLALAYSLAYLVGVYISLRWLARRLGGIDMDAIVRHLIRLSVAVAPGAVLAALILWGFAHVGRGMRVAILGVVVAGVVAIGAFFAMARALHIDEAGQIANIVRRRRSVPEVVDVAAPSESEDATDTVAENAPVGLPRWEEAEVSASQPQMTYPHPDVEHEHTVEITEHDGPVAHVRKGQVLDDRYRLEELLVQRGTTLTWRAFDLVLSRSVLMHILTPHDPRATELLDAARKAAAATDSRYLRVLDANDSEDDEVGSSIVCEYAAGQSLENLLTLGPLSALESAWVVRELSDALVAMHAQGLYHRQLNPDTVVITAMGNVKIVGFLIEAVLNPSERTTGSGEADDVRALGKILYATLVSRWPGDDRFGMAAAPTDSEGAWLTPRQVKAGVPPSLDVLCARVLADPDDLREPPITTAAELATELSRVLGTADAAHDLERRTRYPVRPVTTGPTAGSGGSADSQVDDPTAFGVPTDVDAPTAEMAALLDDETAPFTPVPPPAQPPAGPEQSLAARALAPPPSPPTNKPRRWLAVLIGLVLLTLVGSLIALGIQGARRGATSPTAAATGASAQPALYPIAAASDFDPAVDGGSGDEHPEQVARAYDRDPKTRWTTMKYKGTPRLGNQKPGVGIVLDLGQAVEVGRVKLALSGKGTNVEIRVPKGDAAAVTSPSTRTQKDWTVVGKQSKIGASGTIVVDKPVRTRFLLVYLTSLPAESGGYIGGIYEVEVGV